MDLQNHLIYQHQIYPIQSKNQHHSKRGNVVSLVDIMHGIEK